MSTIKKTIGNDSKTIVNKNDLIDHVSEQSNIPKNTVKTVYDFMAQFVKETLIQGNSLRLPDLGTFDVRYRPTSPGRNPKTGESLEVQAMWLPTFKASKSIKNSVRNSEKLQTKN